MDIQTQLKIAMDKIAEQEAELAEAEATITAIDELLMDTQMQLKSAVGQLQIVRNDRRYEVSISAH